MQKNCRLGWRKETQHPYRCWVSRCSNARCYNCRNLPSLREAAPTGDASGCVSCTQSPGCRETLPRAL